MNKVFLVDDHTLFRNGLKLLIDNSKVAKVVAPDPLLKDIGMILKDKNRCEKALKIFKCMKDTDKVLAEIDWCEDNIK